jgi:rSAM-associated Gly-rich repeat protein
MISQVSGDQMAQSKRLVKALSAVLPAGAFGASVLLALASSNALAVSNASAVSQAASGEAVSSRLQAIRAGVSDMTGSSSFDPQGDAKATPAWWGNGGWGRWHLGWGNGGWHNGGWGNGGWRNGGWGNGGWGNGGWHNAGWGNGGWHNFWHNW